MDEEENQEDGDKGDNIAATVLNTMDGSEEESDDF